MKKCNFATDTFDKIMEGRIVEFKPVMSIKKLQMNMADTGKTTKKKFTIIL